MDFCIDTNILFTFQKSINLGSNPTEVAQTLHRVGASRQARFHIPPRIIAEIRTMTDSKALPDIEQFLSIALVRSPTLHDKVIGVTTLYDYVEESRLRATQGLHIAEDALVQTAQSFQGKSTLSRVDVQKALQPTKENLRSRYRNATRTGFIDSQADLDLLFLARETDAYLVSADEGVIVWGRKIGVKEIDLAHFGSAIRSMLAQPTG